MQARSRIAFIASARAPIILALAFLRVLLLFLHAARSHLSVSSAANKNCAKTAAACLDSASCAAAAAARTRVQRP